MPPSGGGDPSSNLGGANCSFSYILDNRKDYIYSSVSIINEKTGAEYYG